MTRVERSVGRYELLEEIGRGGAGIVYLARQRDLGRLVAVKELGAFDSPDRAAAQRFVLEARVAGSLSHPNVVTVHDFFEHEGRPYIAMEYLERGSLRRYIASLTLAQAAGVFEGLLAGLGHAHAEGIVHRDLKPENLLVSRDGRMKIADFGIAKASGELRSSTPTTVSGTTLGTPAYMAPEQALGDHIGPWTDLYAVGVIAFELFTGQVPFAGRDLEVMVRHLHHEVPPVASLNPRVPAEIAAWIERLLAKDPARRPRSAERAWERFEEVIIEILGARWRRNAALADVQDSADPGDAARTVPATPPPHDLPPGPMLPGGADVAVGDDTPTRSAEQADDGAARRASPRRRPAGTRRVALAGAALLVVAAGVAAFVAFSPGGEPAGAPAPIALTAGSASVRLPSGWERTTELAASRELGLTPAATAAPAGRPARGAVAVGMAPPSAANASLLPSSFRERVTADLPSAPPIVRDVPGGLQAYRYGPLMVRGAGAPLTVYTAPTSKGVATLACAAPTPPQACTQIARTLAVAGATPYPVGPSARYATAVDRALRSVSGSLRRRGTQLRAATTAGGQADAAAAIARAHRAAGTRLAELELSPADVAANNRLRTALGRVAVAFSDLARAARSVAAAAYERASRRARAAQAAVVAARARLVAGGYAGLVTATYRPRAVAALKLPAAAATAPVPTGGATPPPPPAPTKVNPVFTP